MFVLVTVVFHVENRFHVSNYTQVELHSQSSKEHRWKNTTKSQQSNRLLSATNEWTTTVKAIRAKSKNSCANDKQMESQTNLN